MERQRHKVDLNISGWSVCVLLFLTLLTVDGWLEKYIEPVDPVEFCEEQGNE